MIVSRRPACPDASVARRSLGEVGSRICFPQIPQICAESRKVFPADEAQRSRIVQISDSARQLCVNLRDLRETLREVNGTLKLKWLVAFILLTACVDRINFTVPPVQFQTVVEGMITDSPGPYTVNVSKSLSLDASSPIPSPVENAKIKL